MADPQPIPKAVLPSYVTVGAVIDALLRLDPTLPFTYATPCGTKTPTVIDVVPADFGQMVQLS